MIRIKVFSAVALVAIMTAAPAFARSHHHRARVYIRPDPQVITYGHNYGPGLLPGDAFAYYDGPLSARCKQSAAAYRGQDGHRHPCN